MLGFKGFYERLNQQEAGQALRLMGLPLSNEFSWREADGTARSAQKFERCWLKWIEGEPEPWHIHLAPLVEHASLEERLRANT